MHLSKALINMGIYRQVSDVAPCSTSLQVSLVVSTDCQILPQFCMDKLTDQCHFEIMQLHKDVHPGLVNKWAKMVVFEQRKDHIRNKGTEPRELKPQAAKFLFSSVQTWKHHGTNRTVKHVC